VTDDLTVRQKGKNSLSMCNLRRPARWAESQEGQTASLFEEPSPSPHAIKIHAVLKTDEAMHLDEIIE